MQYFKQGVGSVFYDRQPGTEDIIPIRESIQRLDLSSV